MGAKKYLVKLTKRQQTQLERLVTTGKESARLLNRARVLLLAHAGQQDERIAENLQICVATAQRVRRRYCLEGLHSALHEKPRSGQPRKLSSRAERQVILLACSDPPQGRERWTLRLLADKIVELEIVDSLSHEGLRQILKKTI